MVANVHFIFVSGNLALDFAGTVQHRNSDRLDLCKSAEDLIAWAVAAGLVNPPPPVDPAALVDAITLREAIYRLAIAASMGSSFAPTDLDLVNRAAAGAPVNVRLSEDGSVQRMGNLRAVLATVGRAAVELLGAAQAGTIKIKQCAAEQCTRLYVDNSPRGSRRWCYMRECGNRAKAATFRARHASGPAWAGDADDPASLL